MSVLKASHYRGHVDNLCIFLQRRLVENGKAAVILRSFVDYDDHKWKSRDVGNWAVFQQEREDLEKTS